MKTIALFNNKGGVGKTTLVYHIAWMMAEQGQKVLAVDLDPQSNLSSMFLPDEILEEIWSDEQPHKSILACIEPILEGTGDFQPAHVQKITENLHLIVGDLGMSQFEDKLSDSWPKCLGGDPAAFRSMTAFYRIMHQAAEANGIEVLLIDVGPNLGAINRAALIAAEHIVMPMAPGLFSLQGLKNLGPMLSSWRKGWKQRLEQKPDHLNIPMPSGRMKPAGYIIMQHAERRNRPVKAYQKWVEKIPQTYRKHVLNINEAGSTSSRANSHEIGLIKNYQSLMPLAQDARKPIFLLKPAEGAIGAHAQSVSKCYTDFKQLTKAILNHAAD
ncbi:MAG: ParA family protein [bacterium]|nr:ParA family protein [bacterium]